MAESRIEWTEMTWNPTTGCNKVSAGCKNCYAEIMARRLKAMGLPKYARGFELALHPDTLRLPYSWSRPRFVFVNSMSDLFHEKIPLGYLQQVFRVMNDNPQHTFQLLTKRSEYLTRVAARLQWTPNIWMGVSVENEAVAGRIGDLRRVPAAVKFLSCEPLLGPLPGLDLCGIDWMIVGGESGWKAREMKEAWVTEILDQCTAQGVPFFFKQWGGKNKKKAGRLLHDRTYDQMPDAAAAAV